MPGFTGTGLYLKFGTTELNTDYRAFEETENIGLVDQSAGADTNRTYVVNLKDGTATSTVIMQAGVTTDWDAVAPGTEDTLEWAEEGTAAGKAQHTVNAIVAERKKGMSYDDLVLVDISWQFSGAVTDDTY